MLSVKASLQGILCQGVAFLKIQSILMQLTIEVEYPQYGCSHGGPVWSQVTSVKTLY